MSRFAPNAQLAAVTADWGGYYTRVAQAVLAGTWKPQPVWGGMKDGMVRLSGAAAGRCRSRSSNVKSRRSAHARSSPARCGPFPGRLVDNQARCGAEAACSTTTAIATMDWFVQGVVGSLPAK